MGRSDGRDEDAVRGAGPVQKEGTPEGQRPAPVWTGEGDLRPDGAREALRRSEELFSSVFNNIAIGMSLLDLEGRIIDSNPALQQMLGYGAEELRRMSYQEFVHPEDRAAVRALLLDLWSRRKEHVGAELRYIRRGWDMRWGKLAFSLMLAEKDETLFAIGVLEDVTDRRRAEAALALSGAKYRDLVDNASAGVATADVEGNITFANRGLCALTGFSEEELMGHHFSEFLPPEDLQRVKEKFRVMFRDRREEISLEFRVVRKDGRVVHCFSSPTISWRDGEMAGFNAIIQDITERRRAEEELVKLSTAVKLVQECILIMDPEGRVAFANEAMLSLLGERPSARAGWRFADFLPVPEREKWRLLLKETVRKGSIRDVELDIRAGDGRTVPIEVGATLLSEGPDRPGSIVAILRDIAERRAASRRLRSRLTLYELEEGNLYIVKESSPILSLAAFRDILRAGYSGTVLSRTPPRAFRADEGLAHDVRWLSERGSHGAVPPDAASITGLAESLPRNHVLLLDRVDFLVSKNGFRRTLDLVHRLREIAYLMGHIIILCVDPAMLDDRRMRAFEKEAGEVRPRHRPELPLEQLDVLRYVYQQSIMGGRPTLTEVGNELGLSKPTARKRVRDMARTGYIGLTPRGRTKVLELTEKGRGEFLK